MSVATFDDTMKDISITLGVREIYNDIRSAIDITVTNVVLDALEQYENETVYQYGAWGQSPGVFEMTIDARIYWEGAWRTITNVSAWSDIVVQGSVSGGALTDLPYTIVSNGASQLVLSITNNLSGVLFECAVRANISFLNVPAIYHEETGEQTLTIRVTDETSIKKYGRRVMDLEWPLGQTQEVTQTIAEAYLTRFKEPIPFIEMVLLGKTDDLIEKIFTLVVSDLITVTNSALGLSGDFYINAKRISHSPFGLLECVLSLEGQRSYESHPIWVWDTSSWDDGKYWV